MSNTLLKYPISTKTIHWLASATILIMLVTGLQMEEAPDDANKAQLLQIHVIAGAFTALITIYRLFQYRSQRKSNALPEPLDGGPRWANISKEIGHWALRIVPVWLAFTGMFILFATPLWEVSFTKNPDFYKDVQRNWRFVLHGLPSKLLILLAIYHLVGIIRYSFMTKSNGLKRMV